MRGSLPFKIAGWVLIGLGIAAGLGLVLGLVVMWLWNYLMPPLLGLPAIGYWQAVALFILCHLLFKAHFGPSQRPADGDRAGRFAAFFERSRPMGRPSGSDAPSEPIEGEVVSPTASHPT